MSAHTDPPVQDAPSVHVKSSVDLLSVPHNIRTLSGKSDSRKLQQSEDDDADAVFFDKVAHARALTPKSVQLSRTLDADKSGSTTGTQWDRRNEELGRKLQILDQKRRRKERRSFMQRDKEEPLMDHMPATVQYSQFEQQYQEQHNADRVNVCIVTAARRTVRLTRPQTIGLTVRCRVCVGGRRTGATPTLLFDNALNHLRDFHSKTGMLCLNCMMIRRCDDERHHRTCLQSTDEGMRRDLTFRDGQLAEFITKLFREGNVQQVDTDLSSSGSFWNECQDQYIAPERSLDTTLGSGGGRGESKVQFTKPRLS